jgi:hypothetical protein
VGRGGKEREVGEGETKQETGVISVFKACLKERPASDSFPEGFVRRDTKYVI